jgi:pre-mRNA-splicing helicase BRR2
VLPARETKAADSGESLNATDIDAFWLQRTIALHYSDAITAQSKTEAALALLQSDATVRDVENDLMDLFDYEKFDLVKLLTQNRDLIAWCTKLQKAGDSEEKASIEQEIRDAGLGWILTALKEDSTVAKKGSTAAKGKKDSVDDVEMETDVPTSSSQPKQTVDLQALAFEQGGHFMSNKKVKLPEGSYKKSKKGYEEVHVPAPTPKPFNANEKLISITSLPDWAHAGFSNAKSLNRIQSRVYPTAFESDQNMLLCAPTGAGK